MIEDAQTISIILLWICVIVLLDNARKQWVTVRILREQATRELPTPISSAELMREIDRWNARSSVNAAHTRS